MTDSTVETEKPVWEGLRALLVGPNIDGGDVGEPLTAYELINELSRHIQVTVLAYECNYGPPLAGQLPRAEVITFKQPNWTKGGKAAHQRLAAMVKPGMPIFNAKVRRWLRDAGDLRARFDIAHQVLPAAPRYASPLTGMGLPYIIGAVGGALQTPKAFAEETGAAPLFTRLRALDGLRFRYDPTLRRSYGQADLVLGVAPYMREILAALPIRRFEPYLGIGLEAMAPPVTREAEVGKLKLLHVGRAVRTKGLRDVVRALAHLPDLPGVTLTSAGAGEEVEICKAEAARLGVADRVQILGQTAREDVETLYQECDVLAFPSFRESMGGVFYEAMRWGMPVITAARGGPDYIVDDTSGLKVEVTDPETMPRDIAAHVRTLATDLDLRARLGAGARAKAEAEALWPAKAKRMLTLYADVAGRNVA